MSTADRKFTPPATTTKIPRMDGERIFLPIDPCPAPRQSRRDAWDPSPMVRRYREWKDKMRPLCEAAGWKLGDELRVEFHIAMPKSWSNKRKDAMVGKPHQQKPDVDNFSKAVMDFGGQDDGHVHTLHASKFWAEDGEIVIFL